MRWVVLALLVALGFSPRDAHACMNATMSDDVAIRKLKEAEAALDQGDVLTARELAYEVGSIRSWIDPEDTNQDSLHIRAYRLESLAYVRDRNATTDELTRAVERLRGYAQPSEEMQRVRYPAPSPAPPLLADFGEALERDGKNDEAYAVLQPLAAKDLIGSAYANAALSRAAKAKGDLALSALARQRCENGAVNPAACKGEYPRQPLVRGEAKHFAILGGLFAALAVLRRSKQKIWSTFRAPVFAGVVAVFGAATFWLVNQRVFWPPVVLSGLLFLLLGLQRGQWFKAVRRNRVPGFAIRVAEADETAPKTLWFLDGPRVPELLEETRPEGYREPARPPILFRLEQNKVPIGTVVAIAGVVAFLLLAYAFVSVRG